MTEVVELVKLISRLQRESERNNSLLNKDPFRLGLGYCKIPGCKAGMLYSVFWVIFAQFFVVKGLRFLLLFVRVKAQSSDGLKGLNHNLLTVDFG